MKRSFYRRQVPPSRQAALEEKKTSLEELRLRIMNVMLYGAVTVGLIAVISNLVTDIPQGNWGVIAVYMVAYAGLLAVTFFRQQAASLARRLTPVVLILGFGILAALTWRAAFQAPDGRLHVTLLDVGTGDAILIQTPAGRYVLVNGGPSPASLSDGLGRRLPLGNRHLDWLVVAGPDNEDLSALPSIIARYPPENVLWAGPTGGTRAARELWQSLAAADVPLTRAQPGHRLDLRDGASLKALTVGSRGAVLLLEWQSFRMLLPLGLDFESMETLQAEYPGPYSALLLAEAGYAPLNPPEWITTLQPQVVLLSVGAGNPENLPSLETLQALEGYNLLRTDENGWIEVTTDGEKVWVEVERK